MRASIPASIPASMRALVRRSIPGDVMRQMRTFSIRVRHEIDGTSVPTCTPHGNQIVCDCVRSHAVPLRIWQKTAHNVQPATHRPDRSGIRGGLNEAESSASTRLNFQHISHLLRVELSAGVEVIEVQDRVEDKRIGSNRLAAVYRIVREQHHVPLLHRHIDHDRSLRDVAPSIE